MDHWPTAKQLVSQFGLRATKKFGQNFLLDSHITDKIVASAGDLTGRHVIEVGPGPGGLTLSLLQGTTAQISVVEIDPFIFPLLDYIQTLCPHRLNVIKADATRLPVWELGSAPRQIIANLPYNISTVLLCQWLEHATAFESLTLMFQKEVAERLTAQPGDSAYGRLSVMTQWRCTTRKVFDLRPECFSPPPKVMSSVVQLRPRAQPLFPAQARKLETVVAAAFNQRRKMLRASLRGLFGNDCAARLAALDIAPERRAETLTIEEFCRLSTLLESPPSCGSTS